MAAVAGPGLCENERQLMSQKSRGSITAVETRKAPLPVKVRLKRVNCNEAIPYPPDGQAREWWQRLRNALGTASSATRQGRGHGRTIALAVRWKRGIIPPLHE
jgi:hypothetical protein